MTDNAGVTFDDSKKHRLKLWRIWDSSRPKILYIMLNPSIASAFTNDRTVSRLIKFSISFGYGGFYIGNLFSFRTPYPEDLSKLSKIEQVLPENDFNIIEMSKECTDIAFGWGNLITDWKYREQEVIKKFPEALCFGLTSFGHPKHPLFLPSSSRLYKYSDLVNVRNDRYKKTK